MLHYVRRDHLSISIRAECPQSTELLMNDQHSGHRLAARDPLRGEGGHDIDVMSQHYVLLGQTFERSRSKPAAVLVPE
jgi:hypothetical protein